tara:strand:+ start:222 stop:332 length:111 start_codon:yes stop_codon:yes gene_type:complete
MSEHAESYPWYLNNPYPNSEIIKDKDKEKDTVKKEK